MSVERRFVTITVLLLAGLASGAAAQSISQRGFVELRGTVFPQEAPNDPVQVVGDLLAREEIFLKPASWLQFAIGGDARANTHDQVDDTWRVDFSDRGRLRPALAVRRLSATVTRGPVTIDAGKQFIRWGKTDIVTPNDRFAPRDFLNVIDSDLLPVLGVRAVAQMANETVEVVWVPRLTPSRIPLYDQRWTVVPAAAAGIAIVDAGAAMPSGSQVGARWGHLASRVEYAFSFFDGYNHLPGIEARVTPGLTPAFAPEVDVIRVYPRLRTFGADAAVPSRLFTIKGEATYFASPSGEADEYVLYVLQLERQSGEWVFVGGYAGEAVAEHGSLRTFAPDRGLTRSIVGRASYTIDPSRSVAFEGVVRQSGGGAYVKAEYSQAYRDRWRVTVAGTLIRGSDDDFIGQYHRNSHIVATVRYSF